MYVNIYLGYNLSIEELRKGYSVLSKIVNTCKGSDTTLLTMVPGNVYSVFGIFRKRQST